ncbi:HEAT repeat domain-containing protein [Rhodococcus chondri]|uniref:HEAT repeat domain-containing protein n=1 Tax=Rhodococcus chondri TaxID=3065941 RepID=A0ABU7JLL0_9NOCA|nr:HEAT repeat domain-containing protein [Rhodococcus sp. CC-R104]MEE2030926.1 HEAT repeat domain-containing protein [Rhodococcus sp. CC-R104]
MTQPDNHSVRSRLIRALEHDDPSTRLRAALAAGTDPDPELAEFLAGRFSVEPDFFVRDMLTWALTRLPTSVTVPLVLAELNRDTSRARSQALHVLSKLRDAAAWPSVRELIHDSDADVVRAAWRAAVVLVPPGDEDELAVALVSELGRGDREMQLSLSRALIALEESVLPALAGVASTDEVVREHARATEALYRDPDSAFSLSWEAAKRVAATGGG